MAAKVRIAKETRLFTWIELSHLRALDVLPESFEKAPIGVDDATPIHDLNGEVLFWRTPLGGPQRTLGFADIAVHPALGEPLLGVSSGAAWNEDALRKAGLSAAREQGGERRRPVTKGPILRESGPILSERGGARARGARLGAIARGRGMCIDSRPRFLHVIGV